MKNSGIEWIGEIPEDWEVSKIGQLYEERRTKVSDTVYPPLSVTMQGILPQLENAAKSDAHDDRKLVLKGDFAINSRSDRRGSCGISNFDGSVSLINTVLHPKTEMNPIYYNWLFHSFRFSDEYYKNGHGIVDDLWTTSWSEMKKIFIPLPPKSIQQRIASYLDKKCSKIEETIQNQQQAIEKLKAYKQSLITEVVTGKIKIQNGKVCGKYEEYKDSGVEWIGKIPSEWKTYKTKFLSKKITDGAHISPETDNGIYDFVSTADLKNGYIDFENCLKTSPESYKYFVSTGCKPQKGDVLISKDGTVGKTLIIQDEKDFVIASSLVIIRPDLGKITSEFLNYALLSSLVQETLLLLMHGSGLKRVSVKKNSNLIIFVPRMEEQKSISDYLDKKCTAIDTAIEQKQKLIEKLTEYKKSLIYECVTGKKEI